jgi:hypothetical protein
LPDAEYPQARVTLAENLIKEHMLGSNVELPVGYLLLGSRQPVRHR